MVAPRRTHQTFDKSIVALYNAKKRRKMRENARKHGNQQRGQFLPKFSQRQNDPRDITGTANDITGLGLPNDGLCLSQPLNFIWSTLPVYIPCKTKNGPGETGERIVSNVKHRNQNVKRLMNKPLLIPVRGNPVRHTFNREERIVSQIPKGW